MAHDADQKRNVHIFTQAELQHQPARLLEAAQRGEAALVTVNGEPVMMTVPLQKGITSPALLMELAVRLFDSEQISLRRAARIAGIPYVDMLDELGRRQVSVVRYPPEDLTREVDLLRGAAGR